MYDYFYGAQADQFSFYRVPKVLFTDDRYKYISTDAKVLYSILLERMDLSAKNGWIDEKGRVYIIYTVEEIMERLNCADQKATKLMVELEKKCGLIERIRQGQGKPNLIYVKNFISVDNTVESRFKTRENHDSESVKITTQDSRKSRSNNTDKNNTDISYTENPIYPGWDEDPMEKRRALEEYFRDALEFDVLLHDYPYDRETLEGILELLVDTCSAKTKEIRIARDDKPLEVVKNRFMKLTFSHIQYVLDCMKENTTDVKNIKQYLLTALYNASTTMDSYFTAKVNHDMYGAPREDPYGGTDGKPTWHGRSSPFEDYNYTGDDSF